MNTTTRLWLVVGPEAQNVTSVRRTDPTPFISLINFQPIIFVFNFLDESKHKQFDGFDVCVCVCVCVFKF